VHGCIAELAEPLPCIVYRGQNIGYVPGSRLPAIASLVSGFRRDARQLVQHNPDRASRILKGVLEMSDYFRSAMHEQRLNPRDGLVSSLMNAQTDGDRLTEDKSSPTPLSPWLRGPGNYHQPDRERRVLALLQNPEPTRETTFPTSR